MKIAITGKGGVGKTTVSSLLALAMAESGHKVLAIDADPNATLAACLGFPDPDNIVPLSEMSDLIEERTGAKPGEPGGFFKINPVVADVPERFAVQRNGIKLLRMGTGRKGGSGCYCPENIFLKNLVSHLFLSEQDILIVDMEAGLEHLSRGTATGVDWLLIVAEPTRQSSATTKRIEQLAHDLGLYNIAVIGNKSHSALEDQFLAQSVAPIPLLGVLPYDEALRLTEIEGLPPKASSDKVDQVIQDIIIHLLGKADE